MDIDLEQLEERWRTSWEEKETFLFDPETKKDVYSIDTPPTTISGDVHLGHSFSYVHQDIIARYKRMRGFEVFYPMGFDDNGLPTERYTEKLIGGRGKAKDDLEFIGLCDEVGKKGAEKISHVFRMLGLSADLKHAYRTSSPESRKISQQKFLDLWNKDRVYRAKGPVVICPTCRTAISHIDMKDMERETTFYSIPFELVDGGELVIATTRPEMLGACVAVFVNPDDSRFSEFVGKMVKVPLFSQVVKVFADPMVDPTKGTGAEMVCTFGDQNDVELWRKYSLDTRMVIDTFGRLLKNPYMEEGAKTFDGRGAIVTALEKEKKIISSMKKRQSVHVHERCDTPLEIGILDQWYIRYLDLKEQLLNNGRSVDWYPEYMRIRYENWVNGLKIDWCISRQRTFAIPFPIWYCGACGEMHLAEPEDLPVDPRFTDFKGKCTKCGNVSFVPETDVMDTWATSSLSPRLPFGAEEMLKKTYPMSARFQGHDIITSWAFTTIARSLIHDSKIPWRDICISGNVKNPSGGKLSKSKGAAVSPLDFVTKYGADAVRYWSTVAGNGEDISVNENDFLRGRRTVIKLYNAGSLVSSLLNVTRPLPQKITLAPEAWILKELSGVLEKVTANMDNYNLSRARVELDDFFWNVFCDNYLEMCKVRLRAEDISLSDSEEIAGVLFQVFSSILRMYAPILPFITEELYHTSLSINESVHKADWPFPTKEGHDLQHSEITYVISALQKIRSEASKTGKVSGREVSITGKRDLLTRYMSLIESLTRSSIVKVEEGSEISVSIEK